MVDSWLQFLLLSPSLKDDYQSMSAYVFPVTSLKKKKLVYAVITSLPSRLLEL